jgi:uncharacterized protein (TIGR00159 family)
MEYISQIQKLLSSLIIKDIFDVMIITFCFYFLLVFIKQTRSFFIFGAFVALFGLDFIAKQFDLSLTRQLFEPLLTLFIAIFVIVFQPEIRKFFKWISSGRLTSFSKSLVIPRNNIQTVVRAVFAMAQQKVGAIIVFPGEYPLDDLMEGGFPLNGQITAAIIQSIFDSSSPGHDGAILIEGSEIKTFGLHLPLAREFTDYRRVGTRHRAGAGITEGTDAMAIIVSEERGEVSVSSKGVLTKVKTPEELEVIIAKFTGVENKNVTISKSKNLFQKIFVKNFIFKSAAIVFGLSFWFFSAYKTGVIKADYNVPMEYRYVNSNMIIKTSLPSEIKITVTGNNRDIVNLKKDDIKVVIDGSKFVVGDNNFVVQKNNIQTPSYIELSNFTPKNVYIRTVSKIEGGQ